MDEWEGFFSDLRALRAQRGLSLADIAERTRFSADTLAAVESGPEPPSLPALEAYLRGCGEPLAAWEDRWRQLAATGAAVTGAAGGQPSTASRRRVPALRYVTATGAAVLLATGAAALLAWSHAAGHRSRTVTAPRPTGASSTGNGNRPGVRPARGTLPHRPSDSRQGRPAAALLEVAGIGCPIDSVIVASAPTGPGWTTSYGGWTGDGCDGSTVWTMDPNGNQPVPSALTWKFSLSAGVSHCTVAVFVPTRNALGVGEYAVFTGGAGTAPDIASVTVSQAAATGRWVTLGSYPVRGTSLEIQVAPAAGTLGDPGPGAHGRQHGTGQGPGHNAAIAASAARAACG